MIVEEPNDQWMRVGVGLVDVGELDESGAIRIRPVRSVQGITVALAFEETAQGVLGRPEQQAEGF